MLDLQSTVMQWVLFAVLAAELWALVDAVIRPTQAYVAADKLTKPAWLVILGLALATTLFLGFIFMIVGVIAACVYLLDVRPALSSVTRRR